MTVSSLTEIPTEVIQSHLTPYLDVASIVQLSTTNSIFQALFLDNHAFSRTLWKERCQLRWKSVQFDCVNEEKEEETENVWLATYQNHHMQEQVAEHAMNRILQRYKADTDNDKTQMKEWSDVGRMGTAVMDLVAKQQTNHTVWKQMMTTLIRYDVLCQFQQASLEQLNRDWTLEQGALLIAKYMKPQHDIWYDTNSNETQYVQQELDRLAQELKQRLQQRQSTCMRVVLEEMQHFFQTHSSQTNHRPFVGNTSDYYSLDNSLLPSVLKSRTGIPITLAMVYAAMVRRATGVKMTPVGLPGHFVLSTTIDDTTVFVDAFQGGAVLSLEQVQALLLHNYGLPWDDRYAQPVSNMEVWHRMIRNIARTRAERLAASVALFQGCVFEQHFCFDAKPEPLCMACDYGCGLIHRSLWNSLSFG